MRIAIAIVMMIICVGVTGCGADSVNLEPGFWFYNPSEVDFIPDVTIADEQTYTPKVR